MVEAIWTGEAFDTDKKIVDTFFTALYNNHSYATAGSNSGECWQAPRDLGNFLDDQVRTMTDHCNSDPFDILSESRIVCADRGELHTIQRAQGCPAIVPYVG